MTLKKAKLLLFLTRALICTSIICLVLSLSAGIAGAILQKNLYSSLLSISPATDADERCSSYLRAIRLCPERPEGYIALLELYAQDGSFTKEESDLFLSLYNANHRRFASADKGTVAEKAGLLYMNGYNAQTTARLRMALPFLREAEKAGNLNNPESVRCYCIIGAYYQDYIWDATSVREITPEQMNALVEQMSQTIAGFKAADTVAFDRLGFSLAVCDFLYDQRNLLAITVDYEKVTALLNAIYNELPETVYQTQTKALLEQLTATEESYRASISRAYERGGAE